MSRLEESTGMQTEEEAKTIWQKADAVCFDVDSTIIKQESIDSLADFCGKRKEVEIWSNKALNGLIPYHIAINERLKLLQPSKPTIEEFIKSNVLTLTPGIEDLIKYLHNKRIHTYLISNSFKSLILPIAEKLKIPPERVYANKLKFYYNGEYAGYEKKLPTARNGGKAIVIEYLKENGYKNIVFIGDAVTDLETISYADAFIGFGGNVFREQVKDRCSWYVLDFSFLQFVHEELNKF